MPGVTIKIGAIEQRSVFIIRRQEGDYVGMEVGADVSADINLDDFMVFDNNSDRAKAFFKQLIFKHFSAIRPDVSFADADRFVLGVFTRQDAFAEYVQSAEGVPRDGINILSLAAQRANEGKISIPDVRYAARAWYQQGKEGAVSADKGAFDLLQWIIKEVIATRRARAFLLSSGMRHKLIDSLFDSRVLHVIKRGVSTNDKPGVRYQVYKLDYGCYVDLIATAKAPEGLLPGEVSGSYLAEVPSDDYRVIRRAILDLKQFEVSRKNLQ